MSVVLAVVSVVVAYFLGSIPFGVIIVRVMSGKDVREVGSGRTGGTNAMRAAGISAGLLTALLDILKGTFAVVLARTLTGGGHWAEVIAGAMSVVGHNYSLFLAERVTDETGRTRLKFGGGAGGAPSVGAASGLWGWSWLIIVPVGALILFGVGYASVATLSAGLIATVIFAVRAIYFGGPWEYVAYGIIIFVLQVWALRPNIQRLMNGTERLIGWRAKRREAKLAAQSGGQNK
ncbi:MAG: glycerol-3-phosphate acyltransferase [Chloroflexi bacterium]|nr:glycerol-3-phosphate acyltransferase [Chloroflexota bacterium]